MVLNQCSDAAQRFDYLAGISRAAIEEQVTLRSHYCLWNDCLSVLVSGSRLHPSIRNGVDGILLIHRWPDAVVKALAEVLPVVSIIHRYAIDSVDHVGIDDHTGMQALVGHLVKCGYRRIGFFGYCPEVSWSTVRLSAFMGALTQFRIPFDSKTIVELSTEEVLSAQIVKEGSWGAKTKSAIDAGVDAWVCASSVTALTLRRFLAARGLNIPKDVVLTSYHGSDAGLVGEQSMTSVDITDDKLGIAALEVLVDRIAHPRSDGRSLLLTPKLVVGESTG